MKETGIIMSGNHPKLVLDGIKTQTRRTAGLKEINREPAYWIYEPQYEWFRHYDNNGLSAHTLVVKCPYGQVGDKFYCRENYYILDEYLLGESDILYRLTDNSIYAILTMEVQDGRYKTDEWSPSQAYPNLPQRGLHGGVGWANLLTNKIQRLWAEGIRGLVSAKRASDWQGVYGDKYESPESQSHKEYSPTDMYGFSWDAPIPIISDQAFRWEWTKQLAKQFAVGNARRKLDGQKATRTRERGAETPDGKVDGLSNEGSQVGDRNRVSKSEQGSENTWDVAGWHLRSCPSGVLRLKPSIHMPRWASRITLEITEVRVERVQDITEEDAIAEGVEVKHSEDIEGESGYSFRLGFIDLWDSLNAKRGYEWEVNPWVWVLSFRSING